VADFSRWLEDSEAQRWGIACLDLGVDTTTITGRAMAQVTVTFAEMERRRISERTKEAMAKMPKSSRDRMRDGGRQRVLPPEAAARVRELRAEGMTLAGIAEALTVEGVPTATGGKWWPSTVRQILTRD
ncbi:MAG: recombinase family protein, partial [Brachybacterium sp.]